MRSWKNLFGKKEPKEDNDSDKGPKVISLKGTGTSNQSLQNIYNDRLSRIKQWRSRYSKSEYPYKVALNTVYQMLVLKEMWSYILNCFNQVKVYNDYKTAYDVVQRKSGDIALEKVHDIVESTLKSGAKISLLDINLLNGFVAKAQKGDNEFVEKVELCYFWYTGAVELAYAYASFGLIGLSKMEAMRQISSIIIGGNPDELDKALGMFGTNIEICYKKMPKLW